MPPRSVIAQMSAVTVPEKDDLPDALKCYPWHGVELKKVHEGEPSGECPFCGKDRFYCKRDSGLWSCHVCGDSGNSFQFLRKLHELSLKATKDYSWLENSRGIVAKVLREWGCCKSVTTGEWIVPGYSAGGGIVNLYKFLKLDGKHRLVGTPGMEHGFFAPLSWEKEWGESDHIHCCEGGWDGMAWREALPDPKPCVIGTPGANVWKDSWNRLTAEKVVTFLFDNDHPKTNPQTGKVTQAGHTGLVSVVGRVSSVTSEESPKEIRYLHWGEKGYTEELKDGYDLRDILSSQENPVSLIESMVKPVPNEWFDGKKTEKGVAKGGSIRPGVCKSWNEVLNAFREYLHMTKEMEGGLAVIIAAVASVKHKGSKIWVKLISPPSSGKTSLMEAVAVARRYVVLESSFNGLYSGYNDAKKDEKPKDHSLMARLDGMALFTKDADTLRTHPNREELFAQLRDAFDGMGGGKSYGNGLKRSYPGYQFCHVMGGTEEMREMDASGLGHRYLDYVIMDKIDIEAERKMSMMAALQQDQDSQVTSNCKLESTFGDRELLAMKLAGGYTEYIRNTAEETIQGVIFPQDCIERVVNLATYVAYLRARPSSSQEEWAGRELSMRLTKQVMKLARFLAIVLQVKSVKGKVMRIVEKVCMDTGRGRTQEIVKALASSGKMGLDLAGIARATKKQPQEEVKLLNFLCVLEAIETFEVGVPGLRNPVRYRLTESFRKLYRDVKGKK